MKDDPIKYEISYYDHNAEKYYSITLESMFLAENMVSDVIYTALENDVHLYETELKVIRYHKDYMTCFVTLNNLDNAMFTMRLHYN